MTMTDRMAAMGETNMPDSDPGVLARELRELAGSMLPFVPKQQMPMDDFDVGVITRAADYLESLSAPVEDEEKVCREILAAAYESNGEHHDAAMLRSAWQVEEGDCYYAPLSAMREYARRLRAPVGVTVGEPALTGLEVEIGNADDIVGHKTLRDGSHLPLRRDEAEALWASCEAAKAKREADMPDEQAALNALGQAYQRLQELGWRDAVYCPKDGSAFQVIEAGSTGIHDCTYDGEWPKGSWWVHDGDTWPSRPILFRLYPEDQAKEDARMAEAHALFALQANGVSGSPTSPKQTRELEEAGNALALGKGSLMR